MTANKVSEASSKVNMSVWKGDVWGAGQPLAELHNRRLLALLPYGTEQGKGQQGAGVNCFLQILVVNVQHFTGVDDRPFDKSSIQQLQRYFPRPYRSVSHRFLQIVVVKVHGNNSVRPPKVSLKLVHCALVEGTFVNAWKMLDRWSQLERRQLLRTLKCPAQSL
jgi:hypothetical protein